MRFADEPEVASEVLIDASPATVWALVTDIQLPTRFSPELQRVAWLDGADAMALGARFAGHNRSAHMGEWRTVSTVIELEPERGYSYVVHAPEAPQDSPGAPAKPLATWRYDVAPEGGGTRLRHSVRIGLGPSGLARAIEQAPGQEEEIMAYRVSVLRRGIDATLEGVRKLAEQG
ncbi:SRPBCC family protein [Streptomyces sp. JJ66]|uniref:SRPBCC family protein n=1 Tax=Streptomyces sp. JJ66 TaxID=2803843 RepID=UPI001C593C3C|nr:SRPBCC family protein [Streptomyces sp. JJ66]MBW1603365.1 SRPBCC family protein [Streptomyces sp. JJ66]